MIEIKPLDDDLYQIVCDWWNSYKWDPLPRIILGKDGYVVSLNGKPVTVAFLYKAEGCGLGMLEWITSNPHSPHEERTEVFSALIDHFYNIAKEKGIVVLLTVSRNKSLGERLTKEGFFVTDEGVSLYLKPIT